MDVLNSIRLLLGINDDSRDEVIKLQSEIIKQKILNYCNIKDLPDELISVLITKTVEHMRMSFEEFQPVQSTKFGDTSVTYTNSQNDADVLRDVHNQLNAFRRLRR